MCRVFWLCNKQVLKERVQYACNLTFAAANCCCCCCGGGGGGGGTRLY